MQQPIDRPFNEIKQLFKEYYQDKIYYDLSLHTAKHSLNSYRSWMDTVYEKFSPNQLYGITALGRFLFNYWQSDLNVILPHGISIDYTWSKEFKANYPICAYSSYMEAAYLRGAAKMKFDSSISRLTFPPIILAQTNLVRSTIELHATQKRILVILAKNETGVYYDQASQIIKAFKEITNLRNDFTEVNLLIYHKDAIKIKDSPSYPEITRLYNNIYCCGHQYDPLFSARLVSIFSQHKYIYTNQISTHVYIAHSMKIKLYYQEPSINIKEQISEKIKRVDYELREKRLNDINRFYLNFYHQNEEERNMILYTFYNHCFSYEENKRLFSKVVSEGMSSTKVLSLAEQNQIDPIMD